MKESNSKDFYIGSQSITFQGFIEPVYPIFFSDAVLGTFGAKIPILSKHPTYFIFSRSDRGLNDLWT